MFDVPGIMYHAANMINASQIRAARMLLAIDQRTLADRAGLSLPTIQRMEASKGHIRGNAGSLSKVIAALEDAGIELIAEGAVSSTGGSGVRLKRGARQLRTSERDKSDPNPSRSAIPR
jgi:transcriptional regulator with XRE-family HTH domain